MGVLGRVCRVIRFLKIRNVVLAVFCVVVLTVSVVGCTAKSSEQSLDEGVSYGYSRSKPYFVVIQNYGAYSIVYDRDTKVMYSMSYASYNRGSVSPLYEQDGSLRIYHGDE